MLSLITRSISGVLPYPSGLERGEKHPYDGRMSGYAMVSIMQILTLNTLNEQILARTIFFFGDDPRRQNYGDWQSFHGLRFGQQ